MIVIVCLLVATSAGLHCRSSKTRGQAVPAVAQGPSGAGWHLGATSPQSGPANAASRPNTTQSEKPVVGFKTVVLNDDQGIGIEAMRLLIPQNWAFEGSVKWVTDHPGMPATISLHASNPAEIEEFELFPSHQFYWTTDRMVQSVVPVGSHDHGNEVRPPMTAIEALRTIIVPRFRDSMSDLEIESVEELPDLAQSLTADMQAQAQPGNTVSADAAKARIQYTHNSRAIEEEIYCAVEVNSWQLRTAMGTVTQTLWALDHMYSFKAEKGRLDADARVLATVAQSVRRNPVGYSKFIQTINYLCQQQMKRDNSWFQVEQGIKQSNDRISDMIMQGYKRQQASQDHIVQNFCDNILGVDRYQDPTSGEDVQLPSGHQSAWTNGLGDYIMEDNGADPNVGSTQNWRQLPRSK
jgi:hypothetical protein